jgi:hypothetical protein
VTAFLAVGTLLTIRQNNKFREKDKKERLLNEIIEWAIDVGKRGSDIDFLLFAAEIDEEPWGELNLPTLQSNFRELKQRGQYIVKIASDMESPLFTFVQKVEDEVIQYLKEMDNIFIKIKLGTEGNLTEILHPLIERDSLIKCANDLITEATKLKTINIS